MDENVSSEKQDKKVFAPILNIHGLKTYFYTYEGVVKALESVDLQIHKGETVGLVGETGCGKSVTALSILQILPPAGKILGGSVLFKDEDLLKKSEEEMRQIRGRQISMIFQEPMTALNPVFTVKDQIAEVLLIHKAVKVDKSKYKGLLKWWKIKKVLKKALEERVVELLKTVRIPDPKKVSNQYQHELSGGMKQRVMIAMMLACSPDLLIADEPTTALDVTVQAQILKLMKDLQKETGTAILLITHNLGVVAEVCDSVYVMYAGYVVESSDVRTIFKNPRHPYTVGLMNAIPNIAEDKEYLSMIPGTVPNLIYPPSGCRFHPRCQYATDICKKEMPELKEIEKNHKIACHHLEKVKNETYKL